MRLSQNPLERRLQISGVLLIVGLVTEALCLLWAKPLSFLALVSISGVFLFLGLAEFLLSLLALRHPR